MYMMYSKRRLSQSHVGSTIDDRNPEPVSFKAVGKESSNQPSAEPKSLQASSASEKKSHEEANYLGMVDRLAYFLKNGLDSDDSQKTEVKEFLEHMAFVGWQAANTAPVSSPSRRRRWNAPIKSTIDSTQKQKRSFQEQTLFTPGALTNSDRTQHPSSSMSTGENMILFFK